MNLPLDHNVLVFKDVVVRVLSRGQTQAERGRQEAGSRKQKSDAGLTPDFVQFVGVAQGD